MTETMTTPCGMWLQNPLFIFSGALCSTTCPEIVILAYSIITASNSRNLKLFTDYVTFPKH
jgi:hypothetical protein